MPPDFTPPRYPAGSAQPVPAITKLIAAADNATLGDIRVGDGGGGYTKEMLTTKGALSVEIDPPSDPQAAKDPKAQATARVSEIVPTGSLRRIILNGRGSGYLGVPKVTVTPPSNPNGRAATAVAVMGLPKTDEKSTDASTDRSGSDGTIVRIDLLDPGEGYAANDNVEVCTRGSLPWVSTLG